MTPRDPWDMRDMRDMRAVRGARGGRGGAAGAPGASGTRDAGRRRADAERRMLLASLRTLLGVVLFAAFVVAALYVVGFLVFEVAS